MDKAPKAVPAKVKSGKGSKAACEAAGWKFAPIASISVMPIIINGRTTHHRTRYEGARGTMAIPPAGSGIELRQFGGPIIAIRWAVEQLGQIAKQPEDAPAGMAGVHLLLTAALASGEVCGGGNEVPERPDAALLNICLDILLASRTESVMRAGRLGGGRDPRMQVMSAAIDEKAQAAGRLLDLHATTREGLLQKARAALVLADTVQVTGPVRIDIFKSLVIDLIHLVPTLLDERGRSVVPPAGDAEVA